MRRVAAIVMAVLMVVGTSAAVAKERIEINYYLWDDPTYRNIVDAFNQSQNDILVKATYLPAGDYEAKIATLLAGGADIDVYMQKRQVDMFVHYANGHIEPLDKYIKEYGYDLQAIEQYLPYITFQGKVLAIPFRGGQYYTYYNRKLFERAGIPTPDVYVQRGEWTWDKFAEVAKRLASGDGRQWGAVLYIWPDLTLIPAIQAGSRFLEADGTVSFDPATLVYALRLRKDLERARAIMPLVELKTTKTHYSQLFWQGNTAMLIIGEWFPGMMLAARDQGSLRDFTWHDWGITRLPSNGPVYKTVGAPTFNHVHAKSKNKEAAFRFIAWMGGPEGAKVVARNGFLPALVSPEVVKELASVVPDAQSLSYFTEKAPHEPGWYNRYGTAVWSAMDTIIERYLLTEMSDTALIEEVQRQLRRIAGS